MVSPSSTSPVTPAGLAAARALLQARFGFSRFRPAQHRVIRSVLSGADVLAVLPTGAGKSVCFQVPALMGAGLSVVVSPLIALMQDQVEAARRRSIPAAFVNSTLTPADQRDVVRQAASGACRLLYTAPERLARLIADLGGAGAAVERLVVDEAHCISEWGHDFRPAYRRIVDARRALGQPQVVALTGSATPEVREDIQSALEMGAGPGALRRPVALHLESFDRPNLRLAVRRVRDDRERLGALFRELQVERGSAIVYASTRNLTEALARVLWRHGHRAVPYHAGLSREQRAETLDRFLAGDARIVTATCAFGMGIDKPDVRLVAHWTMPPTPESYYQEAGRAGRDGREARCLLLYHPRDAVLHRLQAGVTFPPERVLERAWRRTAELERLPAGVRASAERLRAELRPESGRVDWTPVRRRRRLVLGRIRAMERYATSRTCRRRTLIGWFGERLDHCAGCDRCPGGRVRPG